MGDKQIESRKALIENQVVQVTDHVIVDYADSGTAVYLATLPKGAILLDVLVNVTTLFNASTTDYMDVGTAGTADAYVADMDVSSVAFLNAAQEASPKVPAKLSADTPIYATYTGSGTAATTGVAEVSLMWVPNAIKAP